MSESFKNSVYTPGPFAAPVPKTTVEQTLYRFNDQTLAQLRAKLPKPGVTDDTSPLKAGFLLGVAHTLQVLQDGWTV